MIGFIWSVLSFGLWASASVTPASVTPAHVGSIAWKFDLARRFEGIAPYTDRDSRFINPGRADANYPPQVRGEAEPLLRAAGLKALAKTLVEAGLNPREFALFDYVVTVRGSIAPRAEHDGYGGVIKFKANASAHYAGSVRPPKWDSYRVNGAGVRLPEDDWWTPAPLSSVWIEPGDQFGRLRVDERYGAKSLLKLEGIGGSREVDLTATFCEDALLPRGPAES